LLKYLCGLKQSDRKWYGKFNHFIVENIRKRTSTDPCSYVFGENIKRVILIIYIDDLILTSKDINMLKSVKTKSKKEFKMTDLGIICNILGIKARSETGKIRLSQKYVDELCEKFEKFDMRNARTCPRQSYRV